MVNKKVIKIKNNEISNDIKVIYEIITLNNEKYINLWRQ